MIFSEPPKKKAVAYYRHSAEDKQENSVPIQREHSQKFAGQYQIEIVHEESDEGKSGLSSNRPGFEKLFTEWVLNPNAPEFEYVLVYDVSRWGRFQDQNEGGYFEFLCKQHGKKVIYVSRGFPKEEQQLISHLHTSIERYMAAEYSRQLSDKVFYGCRKVSEQGFSAGGTACYGMTRVLLDGNKKPIKTLGKGEWKSISNERVTFAPRNDETTKVVQEIFKLVVEGWKTPHEVAIILNERKILSANSGKWNRGKVLRILTNETYTGTRIYNKTWGRLKQKTRHNPRGEWVILPNAFPEIIPSALFRDTQEHLYWLMSSKWKKGIYTINRVEKLIQSDITSLLKEEGFSSEEARSISRALPLVFGVNFYLGDTLHWCFIIEETMRNYDFVLCVSIALDYRNPVDRFFAIPVNNFSIGNYIIFSEEDESHKTCEIERQNMKEKILSLCKKT